MRQHKKLGFENFPVNIRSFSNVKDLRFDNFNTPRQANKKISHTFLTAEAHVQLAGLELEGERPPDFQIRHENF